MNPTTALAGRLARATEVFPLVAFRGLNGGMPLLLGLFIGHRWGLAMLGAYTLASSFVAIGLMVVDWGCTRWLPRELALAHVQERDSAGAATANAVRLSIAGAFLILTGLLSASGHIPPESARFAMELGLLYTTSIFSVNGVSDRIVQRHIGGIGVAVAAGLAIFAVAATGLLRAGSGPHAIVLAYVGGKVIEALLLMGGRSHLFRIAPRHVFTTMLALWPFSIQAIIGVVYSRLSIFIVEHFRHADLGLVGAATALQNVLLLLPVSIALLKYPVLTTAAARGDRESIRAASVTAGMFSVAGVSAGVAFLFAARGIVSNVLHITPASMPFALAFAAIAYLTIGTSLAGVLLQALGRERTAARLSFVTLGAALIMQYTFVRWLGLWGVAVGVAAAELVSLAVFGTAAWRAIHETIRTHSLPSAIDVPVPESLHQ